MFFSTSTDFTSKSGVHDFVSLEFWLNDHVFVIYSHAAPRAIALWALGANAGVIRERYETDCGYERPRQKSPEVITEDNFNEHLGDDMFVFSLNPDFYRVHHNLLQIFRRVHPILC